MSRPLMILGARSFAPVVHDWVMQIPDLEVTHFVENYDRERCSGTIAGLPILWVDEVERFAQSHQAVAALGSTRRSALIERVEDYGLPFATPVHPTAVLSPSCSVGEGSLISPGVIVAAETEIGPHVLVNRGALIGHNAEIGRYVTVGPGANIAGFTRIGQGTYIGMGAMILDKVRVGSGSIVGAGSVVNRDVPDHVTVVGNPARVIRENVDGL